MTIYYKDKASDNEWHRCPDEIVEILETSDEKDLETEFERLKRSGSIVGELVIEAYADDVSSSLSLPLWEQPFGLALSYYFVKLSHTHAIPTRLLHLAIYHKSTRVRKKNKNRIRKIWKRQFGGVKQN